MDPLAVVITSLLAALFLATAAMKLAQVPRSIEMRDHLGVAAPAWRLIGGLELAGASGVLLGLAVPALGIAACGGLVATSLGAIASHVRVQDKPADAAPAVLALALSVAALALQAASA
jgi:hypothetical protein